ncbi:hypothetical protein BFP97_05020 [Roseivirga sp. 4D4]|uniref:flippase n=1 Tax=Roseivirga sp. 4D4 TaxID=1889784 RepID=UPI0008538E27|nr:flippase [Roseivirga sp. 4D4]OEK00910.1 hypothetical protein BFP97_05020 [Roseivirga sp. 4D4]
MISKLFKSKFATNTAWAFGGQIAFLMANFILFLLLVNRFSTAEFGSWALYITAISIADSVRQGLVQNGLTRHIIHQPDNAKAISTAGFMINYAFIGLAGTLLFILPQYLTADLKLTELLRHALKTLTVLGTIQLIATYCQAKGDFKTYFKVNTIYLICFTGLLLITRSQIETLSLVQVINCQLYALICPVLYYLIKVRPQWQMPKKTNVLSLLSFGKYVSATNLMSMVFHKSDVLMIAFFMDPTAVAIFHFATKIMNYAELPLHALSQVIYPRISASYQSPRTGDLNTEYGSSVLRLLVFVIPICLILIMFNREIISILSSVDYSNSSQLIIILSVGMIFKPIGRVLGLTLDAIGKPEINFRMLLISVALNLVMNALLIPIYGLPGAAIATSSSILITILIGQVGLMKHSVIRPIRDIRNSSKPIFKTLKTLSWN